MMRKDHLTAREKIMTMHEVGTVSPKQNTIKNSAMRLIPYTLCVFQVEPSMVRGKHHLNSE
jgi:hypothetical protein